MKRININSDQVNFIGSWNLLNDNLCKEIINFFEKNKHLQHQGTTGDGKDTSIKKTTDITIDPIDLKKKNYLIFNNYFEKLYECFKDYKNQWPFLNNAMSQVDIPSFNVQKYLSGDHFAKTHTERSSSKNMHRVFAWMTYLNNVKDGSGCTYFSHYKIKIKPEIGKTLIWPAEWTHAHSGEILKSGEKYIITGWMNFSF